MVLTNIPRSRIIDERGCLEFIEFDFKFPFAPKRLYFLTDVPIGQNRGLHAHKELQQVIVCLQGSLRFRISDSKDEYELLLTSDSDAYYIPPGVWRELFEFSSNTVLMVIASHHFDELDYIFDYSEFLKWKGSLLN
jgi:dTDP-4-dehydrorhamnose 3,5-epimerase-like enzyme